MFTLAVVFIYFCSILSVSAQSCDSNTPCPESAPCCSEYGFCGNSPQHCLAGCNPMASNAVDSCRPSPICKDQTYAFKDTSKILVDTSKYDGNPEAYDWIVDGGNFEIKDDNLVMIMTKENAGARLSSTRFIHYGTITATMKSGQWNGVVVGFITMSNVRDEIDWEFPGATTTEADTNFFWRGGLSGNHPFNAKTTNTYENYHDYTIDWSPTQLIFKIDGETVRTIHASDFPGKYPSTPSRIQLSLWPAGTSASAPGTVEWAGGMIDWNDPDYVAAGNQFRTVVQSISVKCGDPVAPTAGQISYVYGKGSTSDNPIVQLSSNSPLLNSQPMITTTSATPSATSSIVPSISESSSTSTSSSLDSATPTSASPSVTSSTPVSSSTDKDASPTSSSVITRSSSTLTPSSVIAISTAVSSTSEAIETSKAISTADTAETSTTEAIKTSTPTSVQVIATSSTKSTPTITSAATSTPLSGDSPQNPDKPVSVSATVTKVKPTKSRMVTSYMATATFVSPSSTAIPNSGAGSGAGSGSRPVNGGSGIATGGSGTNSNPGNGIGAGNGKGAGPGSGTGTGISASGSGSVPSGTPSGSSSTAKPTGTQPSSTKANSNGASAPQRAAMIPVLLATAVFIVLNL
ncbi:concanavalin A-like lectin/glucanase domain-containing protein [Mycena floridula]|nr:concanavalin A-like lectin/glucanase domain-containing protein [Mycena floridula]